MMFSSLKFNKRRQSIDENVGHALASIYLSPESNNMIKKLYEEPTIGSVYNNINSPITVHRINEQSNSEEDDFVDL